MSYQIVFYEDHPDYGSITTVAFKCRKNHLLNKGMDESTFDELLEYLKLLGSELKYQYKTKNETHGIEIEIGPVKAAIEEQITKLIDSSRDRILEIVG